MSPAPLGRKATAHLLSLKAETRRLVTACGGQESAAQITRVSQQSLSRYATVQHDGEDTNYIPVDVLLDLMLDEPKQGRRFLAALAGALGCIVVEKEAGAEASNVVSLVGAFARGAGALTDETLTDLADGRLDPKERERILGLVKSSMETLATIGRTVERAAG